MRRLAVALAVLTGVLALPSLSSAKPLSFHDWSVRWTAKATRDNAAIVNRCQKLFGDSDLKFGMCYVKAGRANLRAERVVWEKQVAQVMRGQTVDCRGAIRTYAMAARVRQTANLVYLDAHRRTRADAHRGRHRRRALRHAEDHDRRCQGAGGRDLRLAIATVTRRRRLAKLDPDAAERQDRPVAPGRPVQGVLEARARRDRPHRRRDRFPAGKTLITQGEPGKQCFVLIEGSVDVVKDGKKVPEMRGGSEIFGEIALLSGGPSTATVTTATPVRALVIGPQQFQSPARALAVDPAPRAARDERAARTARHLS